jgi:hypothetical protein
MFDFNDSVTFRLDVIIAILGLVTLVCGAVVGRRVHQEVSARLKKRARAQVTDDAHAVQLSGLGITMADGGLRLHKGAGKSEGWASVSDDEDNFIRSEN